MNSLEKMDTNLRYTHVMFHKTGPEDKGAFTWNKKMKLFIQKASLAPKIFTILY